MNPSEKHILEIDSVELSFGDRVILSSVYLAVETGGATHCWDAMAVEKAA